MGLDLKALNDLAHLTVERIRRDWPEDDKILIDVNEIVREAVRQNRLAEDALIARVEKAEAERDAAVAENEFRKNRELTPIYTLGGHGYPDDDDEDFWCPVCCEHLGTHKGYLATCPRCGQSINSDPEAIFEYREMKNTTFDKLPQNWRGRDDNG